MTTQKKPAYQPPPQIAVQEPPKDPAHHSERVAPREPVFDSYMSNRLCILLDGEIVWLQAKTSKAVKGEEFIPDRAWTYISAWNPDGDRRTFQANIQLHEQLRATAIERGFEFHEAVAMSRTGEWIEQGLIILDLDPQEADEFVWEVDQDGYIRIDAEGWHAHPRYSIDNPRHFRTVKLERPTRLCPMRIFDAPEDRCSPHGGPWVSASRTAFLFWQHHRSVMLSLLGCSPCDNGNGPIPFMSGEYVFKNNGPAIAVREIFVASRHGGYCMGARVLERRSKQDREQESEESD